MTHHKTSGNLFPVTRRSVLVTEAKGDGTALGFQTAWPTSPAGCTLKPLKKAPPMGPTARVVKPEPMPRKAPPAFFVVAQQ